MEYTNIDPNFHAQPIRASLSQAYSLSANEKAFITG
jgi:hypothetical protein